MTQARFAHDCTDCRFLGQHEGFDLYVCTGKASSLGGSVLARYGNEPHEYQSSPAKLVPADQFLGVAGRTHGLYPLVLAVRAARERGLWPPANEGKTST